MKPVIGEANNEIGLDRTPGDDSTTAREYHSATVEKVVQILESTLSQA